MNNRIVGNVFVGLLCLLPMAVHAQTRCKTPPPLFRTGDGGEERMWLETIKHCGYENAASSLIEALNDENLNVAVSAVSLLGRHKQSEAAVSTLEATASDSRELIAIIAISHLNALGKRGWVRKAVARLPLMKDKAMQVILAGLLARTGNTKGLKYVQDAVVGDSLSIAMLATSQMTLFDGKLNENGQRIAALNELVVLAEKAQPANRERIFEIINRLYR